MAEDGPAPGRGRKDTEPEGVEPLVERIRVAEQQRREVLADYQHLKRESERFREEISAAVEQRYEQKRDRLLLASIRILESLDGAIHVARQTEASGALIEGLVLVRSLLNGTVQEHGLEAIPVLGLPFDPEVSRVGGTRPVDDPAKQDVVVEVLERGHRIGGRVARPATVVVGVYREPEPTPAAAVEAGTADTQAIAVPAEEAPPVPEQEPLAAPAAAAQEAAAVETVVQAPGASPPLVAETTVIEPAPLAHEPEPDVTQAVAAPEPETIIALPPPPPAVEPPPTPPPPAPPFPAPKPTIVAPQPAIAAPPATVIMEPPVLEEQFEAPEAEAPASPPAPPPASPPVLPPESLPEPPPQQEPAVAEPRPVPAAIVADRPRAPVAPPPRAARPSPIVWYAAAGLVGLGALILAGALVLVNLPARRPAPTAAMTPAPVGTLAPPPSVELPAPPTTLAVTEPSVPAEAEPRAAPAPPTEVAKPAEAPKPTVPRVPVPAAGKPTSPSRVSEAQLRAQQVATQVSGLVGQAEGALAEQRFDDAIALYDAALKLDPQNEGAGSGKARAAAARDLARRSLVAGRTVIETGTAGKGPSGFDTSEVELKKAPQAAGTIEFEMSPRSPKPGEPFAVRVYLTNLGKKPLKLSSMKLTTTANGGRSGGAVTPRADEVAPGKKALLHEASGVWAEGTTAWSVEVALTTNRGETLRSQAVWK